MSWATVLGLCLRSSLAWDLELGKRTPIPSFLQAVFGKFFAFGAGAVFFGVALRSLDGLSYYFDEKCAAGGACAYRVMQGQERADNVYILM